MTSPTPHLTKHCLVNVQEFCDLAIVFLHLLTNNNEDIGPQNAHPPLPAYPEISLSASEIE